MAARKTIAQVELSQNAEAGPPSLAETISAEVELEDGGSHVFHFTSFSLIPIGFYRKHRGDEQSFMYATFEWAFSEDDLAVLDELPSSRLYDLWNLFQKASRVSLGES